MTENLEIWMADMRAEGSGWTPWYGGACPFDPDEYVDLAWADGDCEINQRAGDEDWTLTEGEGAIIAYRHYGETTT